MKVVLVWTETEDDRRGGRNILLQTLEIGNWVDMDPVTTRVKEVVVQVDSKERKDISEKKLYRSWERDDLSQSQEKTKVWKSRLNFEVVEA